MRPPLNRAALDKPANRAGLMATDIRELLAAGGDLSPESWDSAELCDLSPAAPGIDEDDASAMGLLIEAAKGLREQVGGLVLPVHHAGDDEARPFRLDVVELGNDPDGWPVSSCVVEPETPAADAVGAAKYPHGGNQRIVWDGIRKLLKESRDFGQAGAPLMRPCLWLDDVIAAPGKNAAELPVTSRRHWCVREPRGRGGPWVLPGSLPDG
jgi:hypothetical protein